MEFAQKDTPAYGRCLMQGELHKAIVTFGGDSEFKRRASN
jgi:hypothetical protein